MRSSIIILLIPFILVSSVQQETFSCDNISLCSCEGILSGISLKCVQDNQTSLLASLSSKTKSLHISCNNYASTKQLTASIFDDLSQLKLKSSVRDVAFQFCPLPRESFRSFTTLLSIIRVNKIKFEFSSSIIGMLSPPFLENLPYLEELVLSENSNLTGLHIDLFQATPNLKSLFLRGNALTELYPGLFQHVTKLEVLDLGGNDISRLDSGLFRNLQSLRILNLDNNQLVNLTRALFNSIPHLESLDISGNRIVALPPGVFADLWELHTFQANKNIFVTFPSDLFSNMKHLEVVKIIYHKYTLKAVPSKLFADMPYLTNVTLRESDLRSVPGDLFRDSPKLQMISFTGHKRITSLPRDLFKDCKNLVKLELSDNSLDDLPDELFASLKYLYELNLSKNNFHKIKKVMFDGVTRLTRLDLSHNSLQLIDPYALDSLPSLSFLDLSHNLLDLGNATSSPMKTCFGLEELLLGNNRLQRLYKDWTGELPGLKYLDLRKNAFRTVTLGAITPDSLLIDLSHNSISVVHLDTSDLLTEPRDRVPRVLLNANPLACNCSNYDLISYVNVAMEPAVYNSLQPVTDKITCSSTGDFFNKIVPAQISCLVVSDCPPQCYCSYVPFFRAMTVNCSSAGLSHLPSALPVSYEGQNATRIDLIVSNNSIEQLNQSVGPSYELLTGLDLASNRLSKVEAYWFFRNLEKLDLSSNRLEDLNSSFVSFLSSSTKLHQIGLHSNPLACTCNITALHACLINTPQRFTSLDLLSCKGWTVPLHRINMQEVCPVYLTALLWGGMALLLLAACLVFSWRHQSGIRVWLAERGVLPREGGILPRQQGGTKAPGGKETPATGDKIPMSRSESGGKEENCILLPD